MCDYSRKPTEYAFGSSTAEGTVNTVRAGTDMLAGACPGGISWWAVFWGLLITCLLLCVGGIVVVFAMKKGWLNRGKKGGGGRMDPIDFDPAEHDPRVQEMQEVDEGPSPTEYAAPVQDLQQPMLEQQPQPQWQGQVPGMDRPELLQGMGIAQAPQTTYAYPGLPTTVSQQVAMPLSPAGAYRTTMLQQPTMLSQPAMVQPTAYQTAYTATPQMVSRPASMSLAPGQVIQGSYFPMQ